MGDYQTELTQIYDKLVDIQATLAKLATASSVNTIQTEMQAQMNSISADLDSLATTVQTMQMSINDIITTLKGS